VEDANTYLSNDVFRLDILPNNSDPSQISRNFRICDKRMYADAFSSKARAQPMAQGLIPGYHPDEQ